MNLASFQFLSFVLVLYLLWRYLMPGAEARRNLLLVASYAFYCAWDVKFASVLAGVTVVQWLLGQRIHASATPRGRRGWLWVSLALGLGCLGYFKYAGFFLSGLHELLHGWGLGGLNDVTRIAAPIGISFYTFQSLTYTIDIYRGRERPTPSLRDFALFIAFFPQVTSGPIARARLLIPQFEHTPEKPAALDAQALYLITRGLIKKIAVADVLAAQFVTPAFANPAQWSSWFLVVAVIAYSLQVYMDLSGYTDLARGTARCFGYDLQINFDRPYLARTVSNFWQRWHISMSSFFREYLYWALGGSKSGNVYLNLMLTFVAIGLWHGAGWNFVLYGFLHGSMVCLERVLRQARRRGELPDPDGSIVTKLFGLAYTFLFVAFARILFVATDLGSAGEYVRALWSSPGLGASAGPQGYVTLAIAIALHALPRTWEGRVASWCFQRPPLVQAAGLVAITYGLVALATETRPFVYFQF